MPFFRTHGFRLAAAGVACAAAAVLVPAVASAAPGPACAGWSNTVLRSGMGTLENLAFDGAGGLFVSKQNLVSGRGQVLRGTSPVGLAPFAELPNPGGLVVRDGTLFVATADSAPSGILGRTDGTVTAVDPGSGIARTWSAGLTMPNGLAFLPDGRAVTSTVLGGRQGIWVSREGAGPIPFALRGESVNGLWFDERSGRLWASTATSAQTGLYAIDPSHPQAPRRYGVPGLGAANFADDLTVGADGAVYASLDLPGKVVRLDPATGAQCTIDTGHRGVTAVRFGSGVGWDERSLYATTLTGKLLRLSHK